MRVVIVSDTHGRLGDMQEAVERSKPVDWVLHLGDVEGQQDEVADIAAMAGAKVAMVSGNNDLFSTLRKELELVIGGVRIFMTHGHQYSVYQGIERIKNQGLMRGADVVMYGHTHSPLLEIDEENNITVLNPGSVSYPRQMGRQRTYIVMEIMQDKKVNYEIKRL
ncbi:MAG: metallophosphoesterase [Lachnospiraceae bacterium]|nr:metallophosphoesterase [Lachnospiraceae bacterium]